MRAASRLGRARQSIAKFLTDIDAYGALCVIIMLLAALALPASGPIRTIDSNLVEWRAANAPREAGDKFVIVAIDRESLDTLGERPWSRSIYADAINRLVEAGAGDIFLDLDFSTASRPGADDILAQSLADAGGRVILPAFVRQRDIGQAGLPLVIARPLPEFVRLSRLVGGNILQDSDGVVRALPLSENFDGIRVQSAAALLSGSDGVDGGNVGIDYSILPATVAQYSLSELLASTIPRSALSGKSVVVGAVASELKDVFAVPVHGRISGAMVHVLGAETLLQDRALQRINPMPFALVLAFFVAVAARFSRLIAGRHFLPALIVVSLVIEVTAFLLQSQWALLMPTASLQVILAGGLVLFLVGHGDFGRFVANLAQQESRNSQKMLRRVIDDSADAVLIIDHQGRVLEISRSAQAILGRELCDGLSADFSAHAPQPMAMALESASSLLGPAAIVPFEFAVATETGLRVLEGHVAISTLEADGTGGTPPFVACVTVRDRTARHAYEAKLHDLSQYDELTGALRRSELLRRIEETPNENWAVFAINLHRFARINSVLGRATGDRLMRAVADRLRRNLPAGALVGRTDGDGFCVAAPITSLASTPAAFASSILALMSKPFPLGTAIAEIGARIGICAVSDGSDSAGIQVARAEVALDRARTVTGSGYSIYDPEDAERLMRALELEADMKAALEANQFFVLYQPQVDLATGEVIGAEALVRWRHPEHGIIPPLQFIDIAEANGLICQIGAFVLLEACRTAVTWPQTMTIAVNVAPLQFVRGEVLSAVINALAQSGLSPHRLHLEITESAFLGASDEILAQLNTLRALGIKIALDDFGTGYSSLSYAAKFPFDKIKIDQSFVRQVVGDPTSRVIIATIRQLAAGLGARVVCEGIEGEAEWHLLSDLGCEEGQGYYFGKPQTSEEILARSGERHERRYA
ncbi:MAG: EAL domain-containing protein [Allorhizobium sp.]